MDHAQHAHHSSRPVPATRSLNRIAFDATLHCLTGCAIGEVLGMMIGTGLEWSNGATIALAVTLAFISGYAFTALPLLRSGMPLRATARVALAADTASIALMETVDNLLMLMIPGAMDAPLTSGVFWGALATSLAIAGVAAYPLNRWLIQRGLGHALAHAHHH